VAGVVTAILSRIETNQHAMRLFGGIVLAIALALCGKLIFFMLPLTPGYVTGTIVTFPIVCGLFFFLLLPPVASRLARFKRIDTFLGDLTYPVYTLHFALNQVTSFWLYEYLGPSTVFVQIAVNDRSRIRRREIHRSSTFQDANSGARSVSLPTRAASGNADGRPLYRLRSR
jgi:peptidoglycan/LPS O-acetylase OafA/YrhL